MDDKDDAGAYARMLGRELPREAPQLAGLRLASLFCGCGGVDLGFRSAGFELAFATDYNARAAESFARNLGHAPVVSDVRELGPGSWPAEPVDVVTGGFPCVTFSTAGSRRGVLDDLAGKLYLELCRAIREMRPRYFVAENVEGMLSANGGNAVKLVLAAFLRLGYRVTHELVNMAEHGVPQTRKRVIFVGVRLDQWRGQFAFPKKSRRLLDDRRAPRWLPPAECLRSAIGDLPRPTGERVLGVMHGDAAAKATSRGRTGVGSGYQNSRPRAAEQPSHSQTTSGNVLVDDQHANHGANGYGPRNLNAARRVGHGGRPSPTVLSGGHVPGSDAPFVQAHEPNRAPPSPSLNTSMRVAHGGRRSPTVVSEAANVQPWVVGGRNPDYANGLRASSSPAVTMTAGGQAEVLERGAGLRRMTVRECARVQSFPDWFELAGSQADGYRQVGNAVPPLYAKRLAEAILEYDARPVIR